VSQPVADHLRALAVVIGNPYRDDLFRRYPSGLNSAKILLSGGLTAANVIFNVTGTGANVSTSGSGVVINGIVMDLHGNESLNAATVNGEVISSGNIDLSGGGDVQVVMPEPSTAAYFTLGPLSLVVVMLLCRRFSRRKQAPARNCHDPPQSVLGAANYR
jgi:hypothetical protein